MAPKKPGTAKGKRTKGTAKRVETLDARGRAGAVKGGSTALNYSKIEWTYTKQRSQ